LLNSSKTEVLVTGTRQQLTKFQNATAEDRLSSSPAPVFLARIQFVFLALPSISIYHLTVTFLK
jgi:hypothetical protein